MKTSEAVKVAYEALNDKKGENIKVLDIQELTVISDYFIIASGNNPNHVKALAQETEDKLAASGYFLKQKEGTQTATWILLDFGYFIVHIFGKEERDFYNLEHIWADAKEITY